MKDQEITAESQEQFRSMELRIAWMSRASFRPRYNSLSGSCALTK